jgi:hypothetical protein
VASLLIANVRGMLTMHAAEIASPLVGPVGARFMIARGLILI